MFAKVHSSSDVKSGNKGSCTQLVNYLTKEGNNAFFSHSENNVADAEVILAIDNNKKSIGKDEAKFYMLSLNPSKEELKHLVGRDVNHYSELTTGEKISLNEKLQNYTRSAMDAYARNFGRTGIESGSDLMYFARIETERTYKYNDEAVKKGVAKIGDEKLGLNLHIHIVVSRKSADGKVKLSPQTKSTGNEWILDDKVVKRGFSHENWKMASQEVFNQMFDYNSNSTETYKPQQIHKPNFHNNKDLEDIYTNYSVTSVSQVVELMKERGYNHYFKFGHCFEKDNETVRIQTKDLQQCIKPLSDEAYKDIINRFNIYEYNKNPEEYNRDGIRTMQISFATADNKTMNYFILYDEQTKSMTSVNNLMLYCKSHEETNLFKKSKYVELVESDALKEVFEDKNVKTINDFSSAMKDKNYVVSLENDREYKFISNDSKIVISEKTLLNSDIRECLEDKNVKTISDLTLQMQQKGYFTTKNNNGDLVFIDDKMNIFVLSKTVVENECLRSSLRNNGGITDIINAMKNTYNSTCSRQENVTYHYVNKENKSVVSVDERQLLRFYGNNINNKRSNNINHMQERFKDQSKINVKGLIGGQLAQQMNKSDEGRVISQSYSNVTNTVKNIGKGNFKKLISENVSKTSNKSDEFVTAKKTVRIVKSTYKTTTKTVTATKQMAKTGKHTAMAAVHTVKATAKVAAGSIQLGIGVITLNPTMLVGAIRSFLAAGISGAKAAGSAAQAAGAGAKTTVTSAQAVKEAQKITEINV